MNLVKENHEIFTIMFYISDHGFGHASRNIPIIRYILEVNRNIKIMIKTGKLQGEFIKSNLIQFGNRINYYFERMDIGLVLEKNSFKINKFQLELNVKEYIETFQEKIKNEKVFLKENSVNLVISDIVPWIFKCTKELDISSLLISNFTWVDIYKEYLSDFFIEKYIECYKLADKAFFYEFYMDSMKDYINNYEEIGLICREFKKESIESINYNYKNNKKAIVFITVGRSVELDRVIDVSNLDYSFIVTEGINFKGDNVKYLPKETENTHEYLMASDYVITKAGWGTVSEAVIGKKKLAVIKREFVAEDKNTVEKLVEKNLAIEINYENFNIKKIIKELESFNPKYDKLTLNNEVKIISEKILNWGKFDYEKRE